MPVRERHDLHLRGYTAAAYKDEGHIQVVLRARGSDADDEVVPLFSFDDGVMGEGYADLVRTLADQIGRALTLGLPMQALQTIVNTFKRLDHPPLPPGLLLLSAEDHNLSGVFCNQETQDAFYDVDLQAGATIARTRRQKYNQLRAMMPEHVEDGSDIGYILAEQSDDETV